MINVNRMLTITAAMLALGAGAAYSQNTMTATIPFAFQVRGETLPAGDYTIAPASTGGNGVVLIRSVHEKGAIFVMSRNRAQSNDPKPRLVFRCTGGHCSLASMWYGVEGWEFGTPRPTPAQPETVATVHMRQTKTQ